MKHVGAIHTQDIVGRPFTGAWIETRSGLSSGLYMDWSPLHGGVD